jgi:FkbM family methyltransferase
MFNAALKSLAATFGFHVVRQSENPMHTLLGLNRETILTVIDIGANVGQFARFARKNFPRAALYCFEPLGEPYNQLLEWAQKQSDVIAFNCALGEIDAQVEMFMHPAHTPSSSLLATTALSSSMYPMTETQTKVLVASSRLDDLVGHEKCPLSDDILVKLDVQGFELPVLRGGRSTLSRARYCIIEVCLDRLYLGQSTFSEVFDELSRLGYRYAGNLSQAYAKDGHVIYLDALFVR